MDTVLARSVGGRPENKIVMKCPSWPDTPLHQYFGSRKSNQRISDFAMSSLGYVRLYEYCCPCERNTLPVRDSDLESSFVHIEERMRSDGPFILYRRPPQRRVGVGLSERAREKRLLKYYKYFQGFQRKFQVSKQFQQTHHKPENKAKVKKIINCYKRKITPQEASSAKPSQSHHASSPKPSKSKQNNPGTSAACSSRSVDAGTVSQVKNQKAVTANAQKKKNTKVFNMKAQPSVKKELAYMAAVLACMDTSMNVFLKKPDRGTLMTPTLATIEEVTGDCDVAEPEPKREVAASYTPRVSLNPDLPKKNKHQEAFISHTPPTGPKIEPNQLRGILKHPKPTPVQSSLNKHKQDPVQTLSAPVVKCEETNTGDPDPPSQKLPKPKITKSRRTKKASASVGTPGDDISSAGDLKVTENVTLKKEVKPKARRFRPALKRSSESTPQLLSASGSDKLGVNNCPICTATFESVFVDIGERRGHPGLYYLSYLNLNSLDAEYACERLNGHLAEIDTPTELKTVTASLEGLVNNDEDIHIGGKVHYLDGTIGSVLHENHLLFADWHQGQPDGKGRQECLALRRRAVKATIKMNDVNCTQRVTRFLCEM